MKIKIYFTDIEVDFLIQVINRFLLEVKITNFPLKNKLLLNESSFYEDEVKFLYLHLKVFKETVEKYLDSSNIYDENLNLNYKGCNHCLRKCRKALEENNIDVSELCLSYNEFFKNNFSEFI